jgi:hypothetical protein
MGGVTPTIERLRNRPHEFFCSACRHELHDFCERECPFCGNRCLCPHGNIQPVRHLPPWALAVIVVVFFVSAAAWAVAQAQTPTPIPPACVRIVGPGDSGVYVNLNNESNAQTIAHARAAVAAGEPRILHWDPADAVAHRRASLRGIPKVPGKDLDEYPPASTAEGGAGADVLPIDPSDNRSAGARMGAVMRPYCPGQAFILEP